MSGYALTNRRRGMTLLEVMLALVLLLVLSAGVMGFFYQITARRDRLVRLASQQRDISLLFDRVESALLAAVAVGPDGAAGITGDATSITITTRSVVPALGDEAGLADACTMSFVFEEEAAVCSQSVEVFGREGAGGSLQEPLLRLVERMRFRYSDGKAWRSSFDSLEADGLPVAVEVSVWFEPRVPRARVGGSAVGGSSGPGDALPGPEETGPGLAALAPPEPEAPAWTPREPDHVRVFGVPDAPAWQERSS